MSGTRDKECARLWRENAEIETIARETGLTTRSVYRALEREKVRIPKPRPPQPVLTQPMIALLEDGASYVDVAETFHVPVGWLRDAAPGYGWDGKISGSLAHALRNPAVRQLFREIRQMPLPEREIKA